MTTRVLVVDDDPDVREILTRFLTERDYQVEVAADGAAGMQLLRSDPPDVLLLDLELPEMSGLDILRQMQLENMDVKVITISGHPAASGHLGPDSLTLGATDFILKPFDLPYLEEHLLDRLAAPDS